MCNSFTFFILSNYKIIFTFVKYYIIILRLSDLLQMLVIKLNENIIVPIKKKIKKINYNYIKHGKYLLFYTGVTYRQSYLWFCIIRRMQNKNKNFFNNRHII